MALLLLGFQYWQLVDERVVTGVQLGQVDILRCHSTERQQRLLDRRLDACHVVLGFKTLTEPRYYKLIICPVLVLDQLNSMAS